MASIVKVQRKKGVGYQAIVRKAGHLPKKKTFNTKGEAQFWATEQEGLIYAKKTSDPRIADRYTLHEVKQDYFNDPIRNREKKLSTRTREKVSWNHVGDFFSEDQMLSTIRTEDIAIYQSFRAKSGASNSSILKEISLISNIFNHARATISKAIQNPTNDLKRVPPPPERTRFLSEEEAREMLAAARLSRNKRFPVYATILLQTGMRSGEAARLTTDKVDLVNKTILIEETKTGRPRTIPITDRLTSILKELKPINGKYYFLKPNHLKARTTMLRPGSIFYENWKYVQQRLEKKNIPHFTPHDIRHTAATHMLMAGVDIRVIADILGHATLQMAMRYTHVVVEFKRGAVDNLNNLGFMEE